MTHQAFTERGRATAERLVAKINNDGGKARIGKTYRDYGLDWTWETVLVESTTGSYTHEYQALNPRQFDYMNEQGTLPSDEITAIVNMATK